MRLEKRIIRGQEVEVKVLDYIEPKEEGTLTVRSLFVSDKGRKDGSLGIQDHVSGKSGMNAGERGVMA